MKNKIKVPKGIEFYSYAGSHSEYKCEPCDISVNDLGCYQCNDCLGLFDDNAVIKSLKKSEGDLWEIEYNKLKETKKLVLSENFNELIEKVCFDVMNYEEIESFIKKYRLLRTTDCECIKNYHIFYRLAN